MPLEQTRRSRLLSRVLNERVTRGVRAGLVTTAATAGALVGLGIRHQAAVTPFLNSGQATLGALTGAAAPALVAIAVGVLLHTGWMVLWGVCFSVVAAPLRGLRLVGAAMLFAALLGVLATTVLPSALGAGAVAPLTRPQIIFFAALIALSLAAGMRIARVGTAER